MIKQRWVSMDLPMGPRCFKRTLPFCFYSFIAIKGWGSSGVERSFWSHFNFTVFFKWTQPVNLQNRVKKKIINSIPSHLTHCSRAHLLVPPTQTLLSLLQRRAWTWLLLLWLFTCIYGSSSVGGRETLFSKCPMKWLWWIHSRFLGN